MDERALADLQSLRRRDDALATAAERLEELETSVARIRLRAESMDGFFASYPEQETRARVAVTNAEAELARRRAELTAADEALVSARSDDDRELAEKARGRADDHVAVAESGLLRARSAYELLEGDAAELPAELERLEAEARELGASARELPEPGTGPRGLVEWASHAHAELFVGLSQIAAQRERLIREANELASMLLAEPTYGSTVAQALRQVEAAR